MSFSYGTIIVVNALRGVREVAGWSSTVTVISFLLGLIMLMLGIIGEYIWRIFSQAMNTPETVIETVVMQESPTPPAGRV